MGTPMGELDEARLRAIAASDRPLIPRECAERARLAAALIHPGRLDRSGPGEAVLLWRDDHSEAWLNLWWQPRDTGYHDHTGSCVGVHVIEGRAWNEPLTIGKPPEARGYGPGETFWFPGEGIHRMDHQAGAITVHVYSPPIRAIGHYDLRDGQLRRTQGMPDQPSPPSAALYKALHQPSDADPASQGLAGNLCRPGRARDHTLSRPAPACPGQIRCLGMSARASSLTAAVPGLTRSDPRSPGITRGRGREGFWYRDPSGAEVTQREVLARIGALAIPPAWASVWISPDPLGHIQATGVDGRGRTQYRYHQMWREQRDAQKFLHMLQFASVLPALRAATVADLARAGLDRDRVAASAVRLIDLGLFRIGGEKYAELDHHYGATTLEKRHVTVTRDGMMFDYIAKEGKRRAITVTDETVLPTVRALAHSRNGLDTLFSYQHGGTWRILHSHDVGNYIAARAGGHFTAKEFRTWNATVLMALALANATPSRAARSRERVIAASVREVAGWLGDTPAVARKAYIDPRLIGHYQSAGQLPTIPAVPVALPAPAEAEIAVAALLAPRADTTANHGRGTTAEQALAGGR